MVISGADLEGWGTKVSGEEPLLFRILGVFLQIYLGVFFIMLWCPFNHGPPSKKLDPPQHLSSIFQSLKYVRCHVTVVELAFLLNLASIMKLSCKTT